MNTITAILETAEDGTLHLPVPEAWRHRPIRVKAELEPVGNPAAEAYSAEWADAFGSIADESFASPTRGGTRPVGPLDG